MKDLPILVECNMSKEASDYWDALCEDEEALAAEQAEEEAKWDALRNMCEEMKKEKM